jgi:hypothetical protein
MSIAPGHMVPTTEARGPKGAPFARTGPVTAEAPLDREVTIRLVEILRLQPGDRLIVHADGELGLGPGGAHKIAAQLQELLRLDELGFDVPVCVSAPGLRIEVLRT